MKPQTTLTLTLALVASLAVAGLAITHTPTPAPAAAPDAATPQPTPGAPRPVDPTPLCGPSSANASQQCGPLTHVMWELHNGTACSAPYPWMCRDVADPAKSCWGNHEADLHVYTINAALQFTPTYTLNRTVDQDGDHVPDVVLDVHRYHAACTLTQPDTPTYTIQETVTQETHHNDPDDMDPCNPVPCVVHQ